MSSVSRTRTLVGIVPVTAAVLALAGTSLGFAGYAPPAPTSSSLDSVRSNRTKPAAAAHKVIGAVIPGYLSFWGLPPVPGRITITDTGLVFRTIQGTAATKASTVSLAYVAEDGPVRHYLFRLEAGVFESDAPGVLLDLAGDPALLREFSTPWRSERMLLDASDSLASLRAARRIGASGYADSLYRLFGKPYAPIGLIGRRGRSAGRLGEYIAARDSLALDPARMMDEAQLRHALAHELGHRWQARSPAELASLWSGVPEIQDPKRYGYGDSSEHQAEAIAFAISFLQTTAGSAESPEASIELLEHYELLVPGTRTMVRHFASQPLYQRHPMRTLLTTRSIKYALGH